MVGIKQSHKDRGYAWVVAAACFLLCFLNSFIFTSHGVLFPEFVDYFQVNKAQVSVISSLFMGVQGISGIFLGAVCKEYGIRPVVMVGGLLYLICLAGACFATNLATLYILFGVFTGIGGGCTLIGSMLATLEYFDKSRSFAYGLQAAGYSLASFCSPPLNSLTIRHYGWRGALLLLAGIQFNATIAGALIRPPPQPIEQRNEESQRKRGICRINLRNLLNFKVLKNFKLVLYLVAVATILGGHAIPYIYLPSRSIAKGENKTKAAVLVSIIGLVSGIGRPLYGILGDRVARKRILLLAGSGALTGASAIVGSFFSSYIPLAIYAGLAGAFSGGYMTLINPVLSDIVPPEHFSHAAGWLMVIFGFSALIVNPTAGWLIDITGSYATPFLVFGSGQCLGALLVIVVFVLQRISRKREQKREEQIEINGHMGQEDQLAEPLHEKT